MHGLKISANGKGFNAFLEKMLTSKADDIFKEEGKVLDEVANNDLERRVSDLFDGLGGRLLNEKKLKTFEAKIET